MRTKFTIVVFIIIVVFLQTSLLLSCAQQETDLSLEELEENIMFIDDGAFDVADYREFVRKFPSNYETTNLSSGEDAIRNAIIVWRDISTSPSREPFDPVDGLDAIIFEYDTQSDCWHVYGKLPPLTAGGVPHILINSDGDVLAVWIEQ